jgi:hypothetical protein
MHRFSPPRVSSGGRPEVLDYTSDDAIQLIRDGWDMSQEPVSKTLGAPSGSSEARLRDAGKWETVRHHRINLPAGATEEPRVEVSYLERRSGVLDGSPTDVPFALLVSIKDTSGTGTLHDRVSAQFPAITPLQRIAPRLRPRLQLGPQ